MDAEEPALMAGDYNIIAQPEDAAKPEAWTLRRVALAAIAGCFPRRAESRLYRGASAAAMQARGTIPFGITKRAAGSATTGLGLTTFC